MNTSKGNIESFKSNKKLHVFLLFLMMSFLFWTLIKLSKNYIADVHFDLIYTDLPKNKMLQNTPHETIKLTINTVGFKLLKYKINNKTLNYSLSDIKRKKGSNYYSLTKININNLQTQFSAETDVLKVKPDTLHFDFGVKKSKKVKIISAIDMAYKSGFNLVSEFEVKPDFVTISGPPKMLDTIDEISTVKTSWKNISESFASNIALVKPNETITMSTDHVLVSGKVEKITEDSFMIPVKIINLPKGYFISTFPKKVKIVYKVALKDYDKITENSFVVRCDYRHTEKNNLEYLIPTVVEKPDILFDVKVVPNQVEFLIKK